MYATFSDWMKSPREVPDACSIFAIGDVHGCADHLLHATIRQEISASTGLTNHVIHLGDYIDRGPDSLRALEILSRGIGEAAEEVFLVGNHDQFLIELLNLDPEFDREFMINWYENGGIATMKSLRVEGYGRLTDLGNFAELRERTITALGPDLVEFLRSLKTTHQVGDYLFVHAGIDPCRELKDQDFADLLLIREPFLSAVENWPHSFCVVHGHSISAPAIHSHRIGVDAGCNAFGALCALQLASSGARFIAVSEDPSATWLDKLGEPAKSWRWSAARLI